jgi:nucleoside-diphosphate-sugar epimerase
MKVLVTGATGFLGFRVLEGLIQLDKVKEIVATGREIKNTHRITDRKISYHLGDLSNENFVNEITLGIDVIIHCAALSSPWGEYADFYSANVLSQKNLIKAAEKRGVGRYIYISTPSLYFYSEKNTDIKEADPLPKKFVNAYAKTKREAEILLEKSYLPYVILRPRALIGRGDTVIMPRIIRAVNEKRLKIIGNGQNIVDLTAVSNVVKAIILSINASELALRQTYNITNGEPVKLWEKINVVLKQMNLEYPKKKVPKALVLAIAYWLEFSSRLTHKKEPPLTVYGVGTLCNSLTMDITKANSLLGYEPEMTIDEAIREFVIWYNQNEKS